MIYVTLREALYDFLHTLFPLVSAGGYYSSEDVFTALPYAKGRRFFDAVALFFAVSTILAGASYCSSVSEKIVAKVANSNTQIEQQQEQSLVLEQSSAEFKLLASHSSHSSHSLHSSHSSNRSHSSHYSSR